MTTTRIINEKDTREGLMRGVNAMADAVEISLGAKGLAVGVAKTNPHGDIYERAINVDGVSIARAIYLKDEVENFGAQILLEAAKKQVSQCGDGTSVTILLARAIMKQAAPILAAGTNPQTLRPELEKGVDKLLKELAMIAQPATKVEELIRVATISAKDEILGKLIGETTYKLGVEATITAEESKSAETTLDHQKGMQFDQGWYHEYFVTNPERMEATLTHPYILVTDRSLTSLIPLAPMLNDFITKAKKLVIIAPDISRDVLGLFVQNKIEGKMLPLCIKAPSFGKNQKDILQDIAILTGATYITEDAGMELEKVTMDDLGKCESITASKHATIIAGGMGKKAQLKERIATITGELETVDSEFNKLKLQERLGKLTSGVAVIHVGGHTEIEMKERRERVIDGIAATKAAMRDGIVLGGEVIYLAMRQILDQSILGEKILYQALEQPFRRLVENAGHDGGQTMAQLEAWDKKFRTTVFDVRLGVCADPMGMGIIDPAAVPAHALQNSLSVAVQLLTTKVLIIPEEVAKNVS